MHFLRILTITYILITVSVNCFIDIKAVQNYFKVKKSKYATIVGCFKMEEKVKLAKSLLLGDQTITFTNLEYTILSGLKTAHNHINIILDGDCDNDKIHSFLIQCGINRYFSVKHHWLILTKKPNFSDIFEDVELYINADINILYTKSDNLSQYIIQDVYNPAYGKGGNLIRSDIGFYTDKKGYVITENRSKYTQRKNMTGVTLKSIIVLPIPFSGTLEEYLHSTENPTVNTFNRFHHSVLCSCVNFYNFTPNITMDKSWGYIQSDGTFDGMVGALERKKIDYGSSPLFVRDDRGEVMDYGRRTWILRAAFIFRNPKPVNSLDIFVKPLSGSTWISLFLISMCIIFVLKFIQLSERSKINKNADDSWSYLIICTIAVFSQQGLSSIPFLYSGRITLFFSLILSILIYQFYSACIVSNLLMQPQSSIRTVEDILSSKLKAGCEDILYNRDYFLHTTDQSSIDIYRKKILGKGNKTNFLTPYDGLVRVENGGYAFHVELATAYPIIKNTFPESSICNLIEVGMFGTKHMHSNLQKHSPFRDMFDTCLQRLAEYGIMQREISFWHPKKPECLQSMKSLSFHLGLEYFYPVLLVLVIGVVLSLFILILEIYFKVRRERLATDHIVQVYPFTN